jgi:hypothetical protein
MTNKPKLESATFVFSQESNCVDGGEIEELEIRCESSLGIDFDEGYFFVLKTEQWSMDDTKELQELINRIDKTLK